MLQQFDKKEDMTFLGFLGEPMPQECYTDRELSMAYAQGRNQGIEQGLIETTH